MDNTSTVTQWEYHAHAFEILDRVMRAGWQQERLAVEADMNALGAAGWEMVSLVLAGDKPTARIGTMRVFIGTFKRPVGYAPAAVSHNATNSALPIPPGEWPPKPSGG